MEFLPRILTSLMLFLSAPTASVCWSVPVHAQAIACSRPSTISQPQSPRHPANPPQKSAWRSSYLVILVCLIFSFACELMSLGMSVTQIRSARYPFLQGFHNRAMLAAFWLVLTVGLTCITAITHTMSDGSHDGSTQP